MWSTNLKYPIVWRIVHLIFRSKRPKFRVGDVLIKEIPWTGSGRKYLAYIIDRIGYDRYRLRNLDLIVPTHSIPFDIAEVFYKKEFSKADRLAIMIKYGV